MAYSGEKQSVIVTFRRKDLRRHRQRDKVEAVRTMIDPGVRFSGIGSVFGLSPEYAGFDMDLFEAPILAFPATTEEVERLRNHEDIIAVEFDSRLEATLDGPVSEETLADETVPSGVSQIGAPQAWDASRGKGIRVAVLASGIDASHPNLATNVAGAVSFVPGETPLDSSGSGTHAAGIIAAAENGVGIVGVAPAASLFGVKVVSNSGGGSWTHTIQGISWCIQNKMNILSIQLGGATAPAALEMVINAAFANGLLVVAPAGHAGPGIGTVATPAKYKNVIAVSAVDNADVIAPWASRGPEVELCAPGVNVLSTKPGGGYQSWSGSAAACAHVAGAAAAAWGAHRFATNLQIWHLLADTARHLGNPGWNPVYGYGRVQVDRAALAPAPAPDAPLKP